MKQTKRATPYLGHNSADFTHNNKFHRSIGDAFRDAEYASALEKYDELADLKSFVIGMLWTAPIVIGLTYLMIYVIMYY
jgi:hypothetical protein